MKERLSTNTIWLMDWWDRLASIVNGQWGCNIDLCLKLAEAVGEEGWESPSNTAIALAMAWERRIAYGERPWVAAEEAREGK